MTLKWKNKNKQKMSDLPLYQSGPPLWGLDHPVGIQPTVGNFLNHFIWFTVVCRCLFTDVTQTHHFVLPVTHIAVSRMCPAGIASAKLHSALALQRVRYSLRL